MRMKNSRVGFVALLIGLAVAGGAVWWFQRDRDGGVTYRSAKIERGSLQAAVSASGTVTPVTQVQVSSQVSGQIKELFVDFNSEVTQGQLIARLDPETFEYRLRQSNADLEAARASVLTAQANVLQATAQVGKARVDVQEAQRDLERKQDLLAKNFISAVEAERAAALVRTLAESLKATEAQVAVANAQAQNAQAIVKQRDAQLAQARIDLERTQIRSPVTGIIIKRSVEVGQTVAASLQAPELFVIAANLNDMQVETSIDEADISRVRNAQKVSFTIDAFPGRSFDGAVKQVRKAAVSAQNVTTYTVVVSFANPGASLLPGMTANVRIITETRDNVLKVPNAALRVRIAGVEPAASGSSPGATSGVRIGNAIDTGRWSWMGSARAQPAGGGAGALRERLVADLALDGEQQTRLDAILADLRPRFMALRELPEDQRPAEREKVLGELRERVGKILSPEQRDRYAQLQAARAAGVAAPVPGQPASAARPVAAAASALPRVAAAPAAGQPARVPAQPALAALAAPVAAAAPSAPPTSKAAAGEGARAAAGAAGGGGPLREFRDRLVSELVNCAACRKKNGPRRASASWPSCGPAWPSSSPPNRRPVTSNCSPNWAAGKAPAVASTCWGPTTSLRPTTCAWASATAWPPS
jgi:HlyD family secretion protein